MIIEKFISGDNQEKTMVYFSGLDIHPHKGVFNFLGYAKRSGYDSWLFKDTANRWYHTSNTTAILAQLSNIRKQCKNKLVFVGTSCGGYAALLFGLYIRPERIIAFSPQTQTEYSDYTLDQLYKAHHGPYPQIDIYRCKQNLEMTWNDTEEAERMSQWSTLHIEDCAKHAVSEYLHEQNRLEEILKNA